MAEDSAPYAEAKGHAAAYLAALNKWTTCVRVAGPNAGHTVVDADGRAWPLRQVPVAAVSNPYAALVIAPGSEIDLRVLKSEIDRLEEAGFSVANRLFIDPSATLLEPHHIEQETGERLTDRVGSTGKGIGAARADRIWRRARTFGSLDDPQWSKMCEPTGPVLAQELTGGGRVVIEGTQGYGLGLHTRFYPQVTSSDCRAVDFLAMAGLSPWQPGVEQTNVWIVVRPNPIRVAGNSGPLRGETTWDELGLQTERTTVTRKVRRVGEWDGRLAREAVQANGGPTDSVTLVLSMADHLDPAVQGATTQDELTSPVWEFIKRVETDTGSSVGLVLTGPDTEVPIQEVWR